MQKIKTLLTSAGDGETVLFSSKQKMIWFSFKKKRIENKKNDFILVVKRFIYVETDYDTEK